MTPNRGKAGGKGRGLPRISHKRRMQYLNDAIYDFPLLMVRMGNLKLYDMMRAGVIPDRRPRRSKP